MKLGVSNLCDPIFYRTTTASQQLKFLIVKISVMSHDYQWTKNCIIPISREREYINLSLRLDEEELNSCLVALHKFT